jgi:hypothetical protein
MKYDIKNIESPIPEQLSTRYEQKQSKKKAVGFFGRKNPQQAFLRRGSKAVCPMSQICGM